MTFTAAELLAAVQASPERVAAHDRAGWLELFSTDAEVEDPVGSPPHRRGGAALARAPDGSDPLAAFYDTFIGPNEIRFQVHASGVAGLSVARDVTIFTRVKGGLELSIPAYLLYDLVVEDGRFKIRRLAAHWSGLGLPGRALTQGWRGLRGLAGQTARMWRHQGLSAMAGYAAGIAGGALATGNRWLERFTNAVNRGDAGRNAALTRVCAPGGVLLQHSTAPAIALTHLASALTTPGPFSTEAPIQSGSQVAFRFRTGPDPSQTWGIGFMGFHRASGRVTWARFFDAATG